MALVRKFCRLINGAILIGYHFLKEKTVKHKRLIYAVIFLLLLFIAGYFIYTGTHLSEVNVNEIQP